MTTLDATHADMATFPTDDARRLRYFAQLADTELILLLEHEPAGSSLVPRVFDLADGPVVVAFDSEERLADFVGGIAPYVALPGRVVAGVLAGQDTGLGVNLGYPSEMLLDAAAVAWLAQTLQAQPTMTEGVIASFHVPHVPEALVIALMGKLTGKASRALLAGVIYRDGRRGHVLAFLDAGHAPALAQTASEALVFSGIEAGEMDVTFLHSTDPVVATLGRVARVLDLTVPVVDAATPKPPGMDPDRPPRLR